jgi:hypothetical protein
MVDPVNQHPKIEHPSGGPDGLRTSNLKPELALLLEALKSVLASVPYALKPALASIPNALSYMGDLSRAKFYADILPQLETVHLGRRHFVVVASMDRLIASLKNKPETLAQSEEPVGIVGPRAPRNHHRQSPESPSLETCNNSDPALPMEAGTMQLSRPRKRRRGGAV